jgi:hypothetical protein
MTAFGRGLKVAWWERHLKNSKGLVDTNPWWTERSHEKTYKPYYSRGRALTTEKLDFRVNFAQGK